MAGLNVGELYAKLGLETKEFSKGIKTAKKETKDLGKTVKSDMTTAMKNAEYLPGKPARDDSEHDSEKDTESV